MPDEQDERWQAFYEEVRESPRARYIPSPDEIDDRIVLMHYLRSIGLNNKLIGSVMVYDSPNLDVVLRMVNRYGVDETWRRLEPFTEETD